MTTKPSPGLRTSEFATTTLAGGGVFALAQQVITPEMSVGAGIAFAGAALSLAVSAAMYARVRGGVKS